MRWEGDITKHCGELSFCKVVYVVVQVRRRWVSLRKIKCYECGSSIRLRKTPIQNDDGLYIYIFSTRINDI